MLFALIKFDYLAERRLIGTLANLNDDAHDDVFEKVTPQVTGCKPVSVICLLLCLRVTLDVVNRESPLALKVAVLSDKYSC